MPDTRDDMVKKFPKDTPQQTAMRNVHPHEVGWFWRLLGLYDRQAHPLSADAMEVDPQAQQATQDYWDRQFRLGADRKERYKTFDEMDQFGLVQGVLDVYAEESTQTDYDSGRSVWIESKAQHMIRAGDECLRNIQVEDRITPIARRMSKYGDAFQRLMYQTGKGVLAWRYMRGITMHRLEDKYNRLVGFRQDGQKFRGTKERLVSWPWDYVHFRILGRDEESGYGTGICDALYRPWRQMALTEDAMLMYRLRRSPDRNLIMVDIGNMEEHDGAALLNAWRKRFRKHEYVDPASPAYSKQYNPLTPLEDIFIPVRGQDTASRVDQLSGSGNVGDVGDLEHYRNAFFGAAKVPKAYFGFEGEINAKATLMQQDVRFARTCKRIQKALKYGLRQVLDIHYTLLPTTESENKYDLDLPANAYVVQMSPISYLDEWERLELVQLRYQIIESMSRLAMDMQLDARVWSAYVLLNYAKLPEDLVMKLMAKTPEKIGMESAAMLKWKDAFGIPQDKFNQVMGDPKVRAQLMESSDAGFYPLSNKEKIAIARLMHESAPLRKVVGDIAEYTLDEMALTQMDPSLLPPTTADVILQDTYEDDKEAKTLQEDMEGLKDADASGDRLDEEADPTTEEEKG